MQSAVKWSVALGILLVLRTTAAAAQAPVGQVEGSKPATPQSAAAPAESSAASAIDPVLERVLRQWPQGKVDLARHPGSWGYEEGVLLDGVTAEWRVTGDGRLFNYVKAAVDQSVDKDGVIHMGDGAPFPAEAHTLDDIEMGRSVMMLYRVLQQERYYKAAKFLRDQMQQQPKNSEGGYWHKQIYPNQMWLDGAYMAGPFLESYGRTFDQQEEMDAVANQLLLMDAKMRDRPSGLLRHGWDASKQMDWASKKTGLSAEVWGRGMGWYAMAVVDVLERMPETDPQRAAIEEVARRTLQAVARYQDPESGLWWEVMDKGGQEGNYLETSASCMFVYALAKGIRLGLLPPSREDSVMRGWAGIQKHFVKADGTLTGTVSVGGLGGKPYRSGNYAYYLSEKVRDNDPKGVGAYLLALSEITQLRRAGELLRKARGKTVLVDAWFNSQRRKTPAGNEQIYHYKWSDEANSGYSIWGHMYRQYAMRTEQLDHAPRAADLKGVAIYLIVSPDIPAMNPNPHTMDEESAAAIEAWVKAGGVLVLMENDSEHADQTHLDVLSDKFGIHFNPVTRNHEVNNSYENTMVPIPAGTGGIFHHKHRALMKETCTITVSAPAKAVLTEPNPDGGSDVFMAVAHAGKGLVYANVDPWVYNEYTDGRTLPLGEDNFAAGLELTRWLVGEAVAR
jgi:unsaturated rhamnogalacturonyl hydrolase